MNATSPHRLLLSSVILLTLASTIQAEEPRWFLDLKAKWEKKPKDDENSPIALPVAARFPAAEFGYGTNRFRWNGVNVVWDPVKDRALFFGGHNGGVPNGSFGAWALASDLKTWSPLEFASATLDPLRNQAIAARRPAKLAESQARTIFYDALPAADEAKAVKEKPAANLVAALDLCEQLGNALTLNINTSAKANIAEQHAILRAVPLVRRAVTELKAAKASFESGKLDAESLAQCFQAQWLLDEAADALASSPPDREYASIVYDPASKQFVLFGGSHHDYMTNDTWLYNPATSAWRQVFPKTAPTARMRASFVATGGKLTLSGGETVLNKMVYQKGEMPAPAGDWTFDTKTNEWSSASGTGTGGAPSGTRIYRTIVAGYNPLKYDAAPRGDVKATDAWLAQLKPNTWTAVPAQPMPAPERDWGTAVFDPDRDQIYRWTGGHCADPSSAVSTYHPGINRWSIPFVPDIIAHRKGMTFTGRPDCANHTYLHYAYDSVSKRLICISSGGTGVYDPDTGDFEFSVDQPFNAQIYETCSTGTKKGVIVWTQSGKLYRFDYPSRRWVDFPLVGQDRPRTRCDGSTMCYDSKRNAIWINTFIEYQKPSGKMWKIDVDTGKSESFSPEGIDKIGKGKGFHGEIRESVYVPNADLVLFSNFVNGKQVAYDPAKNRWVRLGIPKNLERLGSVSDTLVWDAKRQLVWNLNSYQAIYVLKIDPATLAISTGDE